MGFGPLLEDKLCLIFKLAPSVCRMTFPILASLLVRLVVLLPFQLLRLSLATPSRWTPLALSVFLHCVVALDRKSGSAGMPRPISYAVFCLKKKSCSIGSSTVPPRPRHASLFERHIRALLDELIATLASLLRKDR